MARNPVVALTVIRWGAVTLLSLSSLALAAGAAPPSASERPDAGRPTARVDAPVPPAPPTPPVAGADLAEPAPPVPAAEPPGLPGRPGLPRPLAPMPPELPAFPGLMAGPFGPPPTAMAATDQYVYVLRGNTLYSFDARTLRQNASVTLEPPRTRPEIRRPEPAPEALPGPAGEPVAPAPPLRPALPEGGPERGGDRRGYAVPTPEPGPDVFRGRAFAGPGALGRGFGGFRPFGGGEPGIFGRGFGADQPEWFFRAIGPPSGPPSLTATDRYVYVLRGETLYSFDARTLRQLGKTTLAPPRPRSDDRPPAPAPPTR